MSMHILHTPMVETYRCEYSDKRWCFICRRRQPFEFVVMTPLDAITCPIDGKDGWELGTGAYYGPSPSVRCLHCRAVDGDCFPGTSREWEN